MNEGIEQKPFSVAKLAAGGIAVALIAFVGVTLWLPPRPSPAAPAKATVRSWNAALVVAAPPPNSGSAAERRLAGSACERSAAACGCGAAGRKGNRALDRDAAGGATQRDGAEQKLPRNTSRRGTGDSSPRQQAQEPPRRQAREPPRSTGAERNPPNRSDTASIQRKLQELGYYAGDDKGVWGDASRRALQDFKRMNGLQDDDKRDRETEAQLLSGPGVPASRTFIGRWALDADGCLQRADGTQLVIDTRHAETSGGKCDFRSFKQESEGELACPGGLFRFGKVVELRHRLETERATPALVERARHRDLRPLSEIMRLADVP